MKKLALTTLLFFTFALSASAQSDLDVANSRLLKVLDSLEQAEKLLATQKAEIAALKSLSDINNQLIVKKDEIIENQNKLIGKLEKQSRPSFGVLWGLIKIRF